MPSIAAVTSLCIHFLYFPQSQHSQFRPVFVNHFHNDDEDANDHGGSKSLDPIRAVFEFRVETLDSGKMHIVITARILEASSH